MTNAEMIRNRYGRWADARRLYARIMDTLNAGGIVTVATMTHAWHIYPKHADMIRCTKTGVYMQQGKRWNCIDYCGFTFRTPLKAAA